jgi:hypothetical protein
LLLLRYLDVPSPSVQAAREDDDELHQPHYAVTEQNEKDFWRMFNVMVVVPL